MEILSMNTAVDRHDRERNDTTSDPHILGHAEQDIFRRNIQKTKSDKLPSGFGDPAELQVLLSGLASGAVAGVKEAQAESSRRLQSGVPGGGAVTELLETQTESSRNLLPGALSGAIAGLKEADAESSQNLLVGAADGLVAGLQDAKTDSSNRLPFGMQRRITTMHEPLRGRAAEFQRAIFLEAIYKREREAESLQRLMSVGVFSGVAAELRQPLKDSSRK